MKPELGKGFGPPGGNIDTAERSVDELLDPHDAVPTSATDPILARHNHLLEKKQQPPLHEDVHWRTRFELD